MDPFIIGFLFFVFSMVGLCVYSLIYDNNSTPGNYKGLNEEDENLKYLQQVERHKFWRDNADKR